VERINVEFRAARIEGSTLSGTAHVFGQRTFRNGRYESFAKGAFTKALADPSADIRSYLNHNTDQLLGRTKSGTLRLKETSDGLAFEVDLPDTTYANDLRELYKRGDIDGASFAFPPSAAKYTTTKTEDGQPLRTWTEVRQLADVSPVGDPAFAGTQLSLSMTTTPESAASMAVKIRHQALRSRTN
jgi:HK97 family phage prohead protease